MTQLTYIEVQKSNKTEKGDTMEAREFKIPEAREKNDVQFIRASKLFEDGVTGPVLEGTFIESVPNSMDDRKLDYKFQKDDGSVVVVNGAGNLGYKMKFINIGDYCQVQYLGKQEITKGQQKGKLAHNYEVLTA